MFKTMLFSLLFAASIAIAADKNEDFYVNDCDSYAQLAYSTMYLRSTPVTFEDGVKRLMTRDEYIARFKVYVFEKSKIEVTEATRLLTEMLMVWDTETSNDPVDLYTNYRAKCEATGRK
jgi:hypothetical protein